MAQDMTKVILVLVLLGACLAVAVFRPQIFPPLPSTSASLAGSSSGTASQGGIDPSLIPQAQSPPVQPEPTSVPEEAAWKEALEKWARELEEQQAVLNRREKDLDERQATLDQREKELNQREEELNRREEELKQREAALAQRERVLDHQEASLAAEREELNRLWRWVLAVAVIIGLLALPSIFALYLLWKVNQEATELAQSAGDAREGASWKTAPSGRPTVTARGLAGGNGRGQREEVRPRG